LEDGNTSKEDQDGAFFSRSTFSDGLCDEVTMQLITFGTITAKVVSGIGF
jgi:hypothetical protein